MPKLKDFEGISAILRDENKQNILLLHKFVFEEEGDRNNRKRLREFQGYEYNESHRLYSKKANYVADHLSDMDLAIVCNLLKLPHNKDDLTKHIFYNLKKDSLLNDADINESDNDESEGDESEDESEGNKAEDDAISIPSISGAKTTAKRQAVCQKYRGSL